MKNWTNNIATLLCFLPITTFGQNIDFTRQHKYMASNDDSRNSAKAKAMKEAQAELLQELGVLVEARQTSVTANSKQDFVEEIKSYTIGKVQTQIVHGTEKFTENEKGGMIYSATFKMVVDTAELYRYLDGIVKQKERERLARMKKEYEIFTDFRDGKKYKTVNMPDGKMWMAENLNYDAKSSKCYDDKSYYCEKYGRLYDWVTAIKACPNGWHLPSRAEWEILLSFVRDENECADCSKMIFTRVSGRRCCEVECLMAGRGWRVEKGQAGGTDKYGFAALPGGHGSPLRDGGYSFWFGGTNGYWWSSSKADSRDNNYSYFTDMDGFKITTFTIHDRSRLLSVRCIKD